MSGLSGVVRGGRSDFELANEILSIIPTDPFEQLDLAKKITSMAIDSKVSNLEAEVVELRQKLQEMEMSMNELESKAKLKIVLHDNQTEHVDISTRDQSAPGSYPDKEPKYTGPRFCVTPYISPWITPARTPDIVSPRTISGAVSSTKTHLESQKINLRYSSSKQSSAANSPPRLQARNPRIDGKEFFRQARSRLSYEQFRAFLANIKELNAQKQTREVETLRKANEILGTENRHLYLSFQGLVTKNKT